MQIEVINKSAEAKLAMKKFVLECKPRLQTTTMTTRRFPQLPTVMENIFARLKAMASPTEFPGSSPLVELLIRVEFEAVKFDIILKKCS